MRPRDRAGNPAAASIQDASMGDVNTRDRENGDEYDEHCINDSDCRRQ